jgi:hypothetical protein
VPICHEEIVSEAFSGQGKTTLHKGQLYSSNCSDVQDSMLGSGQHIPSPVSVFSEHPPSHIISKQEYLGIDVYTPVSGL